MTYLIELRDRIYVKGYGYLSFAKNIGKHLTTKYSQKILDTAEKSTKDAIKTASKRAIQKVAEWTGDLIGNKIANKITSVSTELHTKKSTKNLPNDKTEADAERATTKKDKYHQKKDNKLLMS